MVAGKRRTGLQMVPLQQFLALSGVMCCCRGRANVLWVSTTRVLVLRNISSSRSSCFQMEGIPTVRISFGYDLSRGCLVRWGMKGVDTRGSSRNDLCWHAQQRQQQRPQDSARAGVAMLHTISYAIRRSCYCGCVSAAQQQPKVTVPLERTRHTTHTPTRQGQARCRGKAFASVFLTRCDNKRGPKALQEPSSPATGRARISISITPRNNMTCAFTPTTSSTRQTYEHRGSTPLPVFMHEKGGNL